MRFDEIRDRLARARDGIAGGAKDDLRPIAAARLALAAAGASYVRLLSRNRKRIRGSGPWLEYGTGLRVAEVLSCRCPQGFDGIWGVHKEGRFVGGISFHRFCQWISSMHAEWEHYDFGPPVVDDPQGFLDRHIFIEALCGTLSTRYGERLRFALPRITLTTVSGDVDFAVDLFFRSDFEWRRFAIAELADLGCLVATRLSSEFESVREPLKKDANRRRGEEPPSAQAVAEQLGCSCRQVYRYRKILAEAGRTQPTIADYRRVQADADSRRSGGLRRSRKRV